MGLELFTKYFMRWLLLVTIGWLAEIGNRSYFLRCIYSPSPVLESVDRLFDFTL